MEQAEVLIGKRGKVTAEKLMVFLRKRCKRTFCEESKDKQVAIWREIYQILCGDEPVLLGGKLVGGCRRQHIHDQPRRF